MTRFPAGSAHQSLHPAIAGRHPREVGQRQALFRAVNERLLALAESFQLISETSTFVCECADIACIERLELSLAEYEAVRSDGNSFIVAPGHLYADLERVVSENERFQVAAKVGEAAAIAEAADPRS